MNANAAVRAKEMASIFSVMHVTSPGSESAPGLGAPVVLHAPRTPQQSFPEPRSVSSAGNGWSVGWLLEQWAAGQRWRPPKMRSRAQDTEGQGKKRGSQLDRGHVKERIRKGMGQ